MACCLTAPSHCLNQCWLEVTGFHPTRIAVSQNMRKICREKLPFKINSVHTVYACAKGKWVKWLYAIWVYTDAAVYGNLYSFWYVYFHFKGTDVHDDVIKWEHFPRYWPFVRRIHRSPVNSPHKGQWRGALMFSLICVWINGWINNREAGDLRRYCARYDVTVMSIFRTLLFVTQRTILNNVYCAINPPTRLITEL